MRTFDGTKCKVGDVVCDVYKKPGTIIDINPSAYDHAVAVRWHADNVVTTYTLMGYYYAGSTSPSLYLPDLDPLDEVDPSPGNTHKLTRRQVGEGYRIPAHDEPAPGTEDIWCSNHWEPRKARGHDYGITNTYRVPIKLPMVPLEASDIKLGRTLVRDSNGTKLVTGVSDGCIVIPCVGNVLYSKLVRYYEISFDGGDTWQRAEKAAKPS